MSRLFRCGHDDTPTNVYVYPSTGRRCCLTCKREQARRWQRKHYRPAYEYGRPERNEL